MTDKARVLNGGGGGVATVGGAKATQPTDVMDNWKRVTQINMKALELQVGVHLWFLLVWMRHYSLHDSGSRVRGGMWEGRGQGIQIPCGRRH